MLLAIPVAFLLGLALVVQLLAAGERNFHLGPAALVKVHGQRHQGYAPATQAPDKLTDLLALQQQLALAPRLVVEAVGAVIFRDMAEDRKSTRLHYSN